MVCDMITRPWVVDLGVEIQAWRIMVLGRVVGAMGCLINKEE